MRRYLLYYIIRRVNPFRSRVRRIITDHYYSVAAVASSSVIRVIILQYILLYRFVMSLIIIVIVVWKSTYTLAGIMPARRDDNYGGGHTLI